MAKRKKIDQVSENANACVALVPIDVSCIDLMMDQTSLTIIDPVDVRFIGTDAPQRDDIHAEQIVDSLIDAQVGIDSQESSVIAQMIDTVRSGQASVKAFIDCYATRAIYRMSARSVPIRKSNLKGVLSLALTDAEYAAIVTDEKLGLQAAYALRLERKKPKASEQSEELTDDVGPADDTYTDDMSVLCQQIRNAIDAAEKASREDIADDLRVALEKAFGAVEA
jgi:hypothetical protein